MKYQIIKNPQVEILEKYHIFDNDQVYWQGWSLQKIQFQYDKSDIKFEVRK